MTSINMTSPINQEQIEQATQGVLKACEDMGGLAKEHLDAAMKSAAAMKSGFEEIMPVASGLFQESATRAVNAGKTIMGAKNFREAVDLQNDFMKECFDCWVAGTSKISEISARTTQNVIAPLAEHANNTISKVTQKVKAAA